jgi:flagellar basal body-associated protein FliL
VKQVEEGKLKLEGTMISMVGKMTAADKEAIDKEWVGTLKSEPVTDKEEGGLEAWAIVLIIVGGVLVVAAGVTIPLVIVYRKKKAKKAEEDATVNAYKRKIDTTDDKSIDVYADETENAEQQAEEGTENAQETTETESVEETPTETKTEE